MGMCFFKKKKKQPVTGNKFQLGQSIIFKYRGEVTSAVIYDMKYDENKNIIYDVQIGGECPVVITNVTEEEIHERTNRR